MYRFPSVRGVHRISETKRQAKDYDFSTDESGKVVKKKPDSQDLSINRETAK